MSSSNNSNEAAEGGIVASSMSAGAGIGAAVAGPVGAVVGGAIGTVVGLLGAALYDDIKK